MGLLNRAIDEGETEEVASTWDLHVMNLPLYKTGTTSSTNTLQTLQLQKVKVNSHRVENKRSVEDTGVKVSDPAIKTTSDKTVPVQKKTSTSPAASTKTTRKEDAPQAKLSLSKKSVQALDGWLE